MNKHISVGIPLLGSKSWPIGAIYVKSLAKAINILPEKLRPKLYLVVEDNTLAHFDVYKPFIYLFEGIIYQGNDLSAAQEIIVQPVMYCKSRRELFKTIDCYYPESASLQTIPETLPFCLYPEEAWYNADPKEIRQKYLLPERFIFCHNPFWFQEGHLQLFKAIAALQANGQEIHLVCSDFTNDHRCPEYFQKFQNMIRGLGISHLVHFLDSLPELDLLQLIRRSLFVIQPASFEGLHLLVQQCQALGKPILLPENYCQHHRTYGLPIKDLDTKKLTDQISAITATSQPGPNEQQETEARLAACQAVAAYATAFCDVLKARCRLRAKLRNHLKASTTSPSKKNVITIATSIAPQDLDDQRQAIASWLAMGFRVVSLNGQEEANNLRNYFPEVEFIIPPRTAEEKYKKPFIYLDDILSYFDSQDIAICGIVNSDIHFRNRGLYQLISNEAIGSLVYGPRININVLAEADGEMDKWGFDYFFFDKHFIPYFPKAEYCLGIPWWDFWIPLISLGYKLPVKKLITHHAFHITHPRRYSDETLYSLGYSFAKHIPPGFTLVDETMPKYGSFLRDIMRKCSTEIILTNA